MASIIICMLLNSQQNVFSYMYVYVVTILSIRLMKSKKRLVVVFTVQHKSWMVETLMKFLLHMKPSCNQSVKVIATHQNFIQASFIKVCSIKRLCCMVLNSTSMCMYNCIRNLNTLNLQLLMCLHLSCYTKGIQLLANQSSTEFNNCLCKNYIHK